jgi:imidazoleglycerol-phosphate dehydratase
MADRIATKTRKTKETDIKISINLDGNGNSDINTGIGFFDHMLEAFARFSLIDLTINVKGDLNVDCHHTVEDTGIVLGDALLEALGDKSGIRRSGFFVLPMDDALILSAVDLSGRPYLDLDFEFMTEKIGELETETIKEFFYALSVHGALNIHFKKLNGTNSHHICEAMFKSFGKALREASEYDGRIKGILSTKGII